MVSPYGGELMATGSIVKGILVPGIPHPLLAHEQNEGWGRLRAGFEEARREIEATEADLILIYSTMWPSVIGHQIQAQPEPEWIHVDELFHDLGSIPYKFQIDTEFAHTFKECAINRGLHARTIAYHGFPIDTGSVVALKLLNPDNRIPACIVSSNVYADRAETTVLAKAARDAIDKLGKKVAIVTVMTLSNRLFTDWIDPETDHVHSQKDDEWNHKLLEFLGEGRLEDVAQLSREIHQQIRVKKVVNFKPMWWTAGVMGQTNNYAGRVLAYEALYGTGAAVISLTPSALGFGDKEYDEDDVEVFGGDRGVLSQSGGGAETLTAAQPLSSPPRSREQPPSQSAATTINTDAAPKPVGAYPHARREGDFLFLSGVGPRQAGGKPIPGGPIRDESGAPLNYDIEAQTRAVIENIKTILEAAGSSLEEVVDVTAFLVDMDRDFAGYNKIYREYFESIQATRTTIAVRALPTPIAVELKVVARP
jgi:reactive intermediate/imine deaminase